MSSKHYKFDVTMTCSGCSNAVNRVLTRLPGVKNVDISLEKQTVDVISDLDYDTVLQAISKTGKKVNGGTIVTRQGIAAGPRINKFVPRCFPLGAPDMERGRVQGAVSRKRHQLHPRDSLFCRAVRVVPASKAVFGPSRRQPQHRRQTGGRDHGRISVGSGIVPDGSGEDEALCADSAAQKPQEPGLSREAAWDVAESCEYLSQRGRHICALSRYYADLVGRGAVHGAQLHDVREHEGAGARETPQKPSRRAHSGSHQRECRADYNLSDGRFAPAVPSGDARGRRNGVPVQVDGGCAGPDRAQGRVQGPVQGTACEHLEDLSGDGCAMDELRSDKKYAPIVGKIERQTDGPACSDVISVYFFYREQSQG
ncbi:hypothetical protein KL930_003161 [Ogataea haglerorum]|uniref:HMA domain-containing protein n=1 Tax=Ogataea haglerorum TaxID=1937702 RepID=A0ABQ7RHT1_9ASCO|nr:hypothetical protein KL914_002934 [Ogataea haglerorum]KAG7713814.1 hypothetical protein KL913_004838 [Ogataea haglerorum]KAG7714247.1 hypothetical protein KL949_004877 [Ogataea haglerorum]KAG7734354.1 hypothetical protein KL932_004808 [Ogataea haglerorum]KAG7758783.1 hypothetical protein KL947_002452 [Ogataea haglerorum]